MIIDYLDVRNKIYREIIINKNLKYKLVKYSNLIESWFKTENDSITNEMK